MTDVRSRLPRPALWWTVLCLTAAVLLIGVGAMLVMTGEADDSPGLGGLGLLNGLVGLVMAVRTIAAARRPRGGFPLHH